MVIKSIAIEFVPASRWQVNAIIENVMGWRNSKSIELSRSDDPTLRSLIGWPVPHKRSTHMRDPKCDQDCKQKRRCDSREISVSRGEKMLKYAFLEPHSVVLVLLFLWFVLWINHLPLVGSIFGKNPF